MRDKILEAMRQRDCILGVTPDHGGMWLSGLRSPEPRIFSENPESWPVFLQKLSEIALDDCEINLNLVPLQISKASVFWGIYFSSNNTSLVVNSGILTDNPLAVVLTPVAEKPISIVIKRVGNSVEIICDEIPKGKRSGNANDLSAAELGNVVSEFHGYFLSASLINLTTGETVWQASHDELYETYPWPSDVPRDFAEEPAIWSDFPMDTGNDFELEISFIIEPAEEIIYSKYIFGSGSKYVYPIRVLTVPDQSNPQNTAIICNIYDGTAPYRAFSLSGTEENFPGKHTMHFNYKAGTLEVYLDGTLKSTRGTPLAPQVDFPITEIGRDVVIFYKPPTGRTVWSYPSEAERVRLLTKTNVRTDRGVFEAADETKISGISTMLDLRGNTTSKTFIVRAFCPAHDPASGKLYIHPFFGQGAINQSASLYTFQFSLWEDRRNGGTVQLFPAISTGTDTPGANVVDAEIYLDQWHTYAMVVDYNDGSCYIRAFVDGVLLRERAVSGTPVWNTPAATTAQETTVGIRRDPNSSYHAGSLTRVSSALVFDRALTAAEIAALS